MSWKYTGDGRPPFAVEPGPGEESVWDYPRPLRMEADRRLWLTTEIVGLVKGEPGTGGW